MCAIRKGSFELTMLSSLRPFARQGLYSVTSASYQRCDIFSCDGL